MKLIHEIMEAVNQGGAMAGAAAIIGIIATYFIKKRATDVTLTVDERKQLSMDEHDFRKSILYQLKACQIAHQQSIDEREIFRKLNVALERRISELESNCFSCLYRASGQDK